MHFKIFSRSIVLPCLTFTAIGISIAIFQNCSKFAASAISNVSTTAAPTHDLGNGAGSNYCQGAPADPNCASIQSSGCNFNGQGVAIGALVTAYLSSTGAACTSEKRNCSNSGLSGSYAYASCSPQTLKSCLFNGQTLASGSQIKAYLAGTTATPASECQVEVRSCSDGTLSGSYDYANCQPGVGVPCLFNGQMVSHGMSVNAYATSSVAAGMVCRSQLRTCFNGALSGAGNFASCQVSAPAACLFNGTTIANGQTIIAFAQSAVTAGQTCVAISRTCANGTLSGVASYANCSVNQPQACLVGGTTVANGASITLYLQDHAAASALCTTETRTCVNGSLSGSATYSSCSLDPVQYSQLPNTDPNAIFRTVNDLVPTGTAYDDTVPDTIDLAEVAHGFIQGLTSSLMSSHDFAPPGHIYYFGDAVNPPTQIIEGGVPNWGKSVQALVMARRMSGYDLDNHDGTLNVQLQTTRNMLDAHVNLNFLNRSPSEGAWIVYPNVQNVTPMTVALESMIEIYKQNRSPGLEILIRQMMAFQTQAGQSTTQNGEAMLYYANVDETGNDDESQQSVGVPGRYVQPFLIGKAMRSMGSWYALFGDAAAFERMTQLSAFMRNYRTNLFWQLPSVVPSGAGHFAGHEHGFLNGMMGLLAQAEARRRADPNDAQAQALLQFVNGSYLFVRDYQGGRSTGVNEFGGGVSTLGNFGEICTVGDMIRLATKLTDLGAGDYYDDVDRWLRNTIAEAQIKSTAPINNYAHPENDMIDHIGSRAAGLFYEDATHPFAIPTDRNTGAFQSVACGLGNPMMGIYDAWTHIAQIKGSFAQVNLLMNRASRYFDIRSELPYRRFVHVGTKSDIGPIQNLGIRIPNWANKSLVHVYRNGIDIVGQWSYQVGNYVIIPNITPNTDYAVQITLDNYTLPILQIKGQDQMWQESNLASSNAAYTLSNYTGTFRAGTLIDVDHRPTGGLALYVRPTLKDLSGAGTPAPLKSVRRFVPVVE